MTSMLAADSEEDGDGGGELEGARADISVTSVSVEEACGSLLVRLVLVVWRLGSSAGILLSWVKVEEFEVGRLVGFRVLRVEPSLALASAESLEIPVSFSFMLAAFQRLSAGNLLNSKMVESSRIRLGGCWC